jgi:DNA-binding response OmpR family regulator
LPSIYAGSHATYVLGGLPNQEQADHPQLLFVSAEHSADHLAALRSHFDVTTATSEPGAVHDVLARRPPFVLIDLALRDAEGIVRAAKTLSPPAIVLVITDAPERVPDALRAGCDGVLLAPLTANLLCARLGRLKRDAEIRVTLGRARAAAAPSSGTNRIWPELPCPQCHEVGIVGFDHTSYRRMWYACTRCGHVWIDRRRE